MIRNVKHSKEMKKLDENIENLFGDQKKGQPFRVPEGYFESFADRLKVRIEAEKYAANNRSLLRNLKPVLAVAACFALAMMLVYVPFKKYFPSDKGYVSQQASINNYSVDSVSNFPLNLISDFSDDQFFMALSDMNEIESKTLSSENLADYISANYNDYEIIANN